MKYNFNGVFGPDLCGIATSGFFAGGHFGFSFQFSWPLLKISFFRSLGVIVSEYHFQNTEKGRFYDVQ